MEDGLLGSEDGAGELLSLEFDAVSDLVSEEEFESLEGLESVCEEISVLLFSTGGLGRP